jgi:hypothetical protein
LLLLTFVSLWAASLNLEPRSAGEARAPLPERFPGAIIQVYGADVWGIRGKFAIHTWIATKQRNADHYEIFQVIGWRARHGRPVLSIEQGDPARDWFGSPAILLHEKRGPVAGELIDRIHEAVEAYPFAHEYTMWPGPNSNSFTAWIGLQVPELGLDLPAKAVGESWMRRNYGKLTNGRQESL